MYEEETLKVEKEDKKILQILEDWELYKDNYVCGGCQR